MPYKNVEKESESFAVKHRVRVVVIAISPLLITLYMSYETIRA